MLGGKPWPPRGEDRSWESELRVHLSRLPRGNHLEAYFTAGFCSSGAYS